MSPPRKRDGPRGGGPKAQQSAHDSTNNTAPTPAPQRPDGDVDEHEFHEQASKELADVVTYLDILAMQLGIDLGQAVVDKFNEVSRRVGSTVRIEADHWHHVHT
jgi:hypothetical protein